jgi:PfaD family protein
VRFPYVAGEMARGIAGARLVSAMARAEMLAFFGAGGLGIAALDHALHRLGAELPDRRNWGVNLICTPGDTALEERTADRLVRARVPRISASAYLELTPAVVRCAATGLRVDRAGKIVRPVAMFAKVSRPDLAESFMRPAPVHLLRHLVERGQLTEEEARLAGRVPVAEDITVEADSGGHTDRRPLLALLPSVLDLRDRLAQEQPPARPVRVGAAGGLGDPAAVAAAFALGAAYVVTGSVNQMAVEAEVSDRAKAMLAEADVTDVAMAPAGDMFELGAKVQVLRRGTMFAGRATRLEQVYRTYPSLEAIQPAERLLLERDTLGASLDDVWNWTRAYWGRRRPLELERAEADPKHRMALVFRWYLSQSSHWAITGEAGRTADYQLWCGPAVGAFNRWTEGTFLARPEQRTVTQIAVNLIQGAAVLTRAHTLRSHGVLLPPAAFRYRPRRLR